MIPDANETVGGFGANLLNLTTEAMFTLTDKCVIPLLAYIYTR